MRLGTGRKEDTGAVEGVQECYMGRRMFWAERFKGTVGKVKEGERPADRMSRAGGSQRPEGARMVPRGLAR